MPCLMLGQAALATEASFALRNRYLERELSVVDGVLTTTQIRNKLANIAQKPIGGSEFRLRISEGTDKTGTDVILTAADFKVLKLKRTSTGAVAQLESKAHGLRVAVHYFLEPDEPVLRKQLEITADRPVTLERIDIDSLALNDVYQPYQQKAITARQPRNWKPGLGQPLFTSKSAWFMGTEFPASFNYVENGQYYCGYLYGHELKAGEILKTYPAVLGVGDDAAYITEAFQDYINNIRVRALRLQTQYNSWFDFGRSVSGESFARSVEKVNNELCVKRGVKPLKAYVIDDGWQDSKANSDWSSQVWTVNSKFDSDFSQSFKLMQNTGSNLGLWLSPGCNFGARKIVPTLREMGMGGLKNYMSLANSTYMDMLEERMVGLTELGVTYFKLDGLFGHLNTRDFDLNGTARGVPAMPQLGTAEMASDDPALNDSKYDEAKMYYLTVGTERLMRIFDKMARANPEVYIVISNGAWLSPWWLMHVDAVWMINAGDAAKGADRTSELVYRDGVYYEIWKQENTQFPMNALFNHEPKKKTTGESRKTFRDYLFMNLSRGTGFIELYLKTEKLSEADWDVLAEGMTWAETAFPAFRRVRMHGGDPRKNEVYGYSAWNKTQGYVSFHNPGDGAKEYRITLNRSLGVIPGSGPFKVYSSLPGSLKGLEKTYRFGDTISVTLQSKEIRLFDFIERDGRFTKTTKRI